MRTLLIGTGVWLLLAWLAAAPAVRAERTAVQPLAAFPGDSVYQLSMSLRDPEGKPKALAVWSGHPVLIAMVYTSCKSVCPLIVADLRRIEAALSPAAREKTRVLLVSLDARRDDPSALRKFSERHRIDARRWLIATPGSNDVRPLAALLGVRYRSLPNGELLHTPQITLLDGGGTPRARIEGVSADASALVAAIESAAGRTAAVGSTR